MYNIYVEMLLLFWYFVLHHFSLFINLSRHDHSDTLDLRGCNSTLLIPTQPKPFAVQHKFKE